MFGHIVNTDSLAVMDAIAALQIVDASAYFGSDFTTLPVIDYTSGSLSESNLVEVASVTRLTSHPAFFDGEVSVGNAVNYLTFADGTPFGYYSYLTDQNYIYHFDLGYEYVFDAADGKDGVYLYDFASNTFFYTSARRSPFPISTTSRWTRCSTTSRTRAAPGITRPTRATSTTSPPARSSPSSLWAAPSRHSLAPRPPGFDR